ncbi:hypothetical protein BJV85_002514 [Clostridium acetobutylicum]|uniref:Uncharacterized membrane protein,ortholog of YDFK B.subtilis n=1 Tax=Clostridium acetobutylicum (strain ATCC 824 / DSM 792 / JCM 1419 / IAM 19013 / LMG 5710 / NBRC 13948 / NRRL B-527 / VKM B-1787 / 2291 / W) TaxID=272562 RepID=Q97J04_CLOAB|nr:MULTISPECIES: DUF554 domain-containing protein [Clostridium]AAK79450.1 Uncharacterized membrane protein,ortholog of YDFK B.subtilis [Clostridium acetobutylicum ATCC 824]ADZ20535.1 Conserved hypothetical protein [Clostridium acetobutylicum EA 2018]AEI34193.1 hypothetical protein SMB_G1507 [Clostridium acetobutylicum DSM 1731]AWV81304.1 DUF554 domain-containing protein [Clostridium acetobutylicum]MBC2392938.1 DUF554 domain-containing protein [Clostridium acetobutylicum]
MLAGVIINVLSVVFGGITGTLAGKKLSKEFKANLTLVLGVCSMGMGISSIGLMKNMPAVVFAVVLGTVVGIILNLGKWINKAAEEMQKPIVKLFGNQNSNLSNEEFISTLVTIIVLFCASGTGIYGSLTAGMTGDNTVLISKSILDFFTAAIFACNLGLVVSVVAIPQFFIFLLLFLGAKVIFPLTTQSMVFDFKACGGFLMLATGFRMVKLKEFPIADMIPAMVLVMPFSWLWVNWILPML